MFQKPGVPLSKTTLITHCYSDLSFMDFICTMVTRSVQVPSLTLFVLCEGSELLWAELLVRRNRFCSVGFNVTR